MVDRSLLFTHGQEYLYIHELVRQFAARKLGQTPALQVAAQQQHCEYYLRLLTDWWENSENQRVVSVLLPELDNIYPAYDWAFNQQNFVLFHGAILSFMRFHIYAGLNWDGHQQVSTYHEKFIKLVEHKPDCIDPQRLQEIKTTFSVADGLFLAHLGHFEQAKERLAEVEAEIRQYGYWHLMNSVQQMLGCLYENPSTIDKARYHFEQALRYAQPHQKIAAHLCLSMIARRQGDLIEAASHLEQAHQQFLTGCDITTEALYYSIYSDLCHAQGRWSEALAHALKNIELVSQQQTAMPFFHYSSKILWQSGRFEMARHYLEQVDSNSKQEAYHFGGYWHTLWLIDVADFYVAWQQPEQALFYSQLANKNAQKLGRKDLLGRALKTEGASQLQLEQLDAATENLTEARQILHDEMASDYECIALSILIHLHLALEDHTQVATYTQLLWEQLHSGKLDMINAEPIKAWWACYLGFLALGDSRADNALQTACEMFQTQLAFIDDEQWRIDFSTNIPEHRMLLRMINDYSK